MSAHSAPLSVEERAWRYVSKIEPAVAGQGGHDRTFHVAATLVVGFDLGEQAAFDLLARWNQGCLPPWTEAELRHKVQDAIKRKASAGAEVGRLLGKTGGGNRRRARGSAVYLGSLSHNSRRGTGEGKDGGVGIRPSVQVPVSLPDSPVEPGSVEEMVRELRRMAAAPRQAFVSEHGADPRCVLVPEEWAAEFADRGILFIDGLEIQPHEDTEVRVR